MAAKRTNEKRERMIGVKCSESEFERIREAAFKARKSLGGYLRDLALGGKK